MGAVLQVAVEEVDPVAAGFSEHYLPVRFSRAGSKAGSLADVRVLEIKGESEDGAVDGGVFLWGKEVCGAWSGGE